MIVHIVISVIHSLLKKYRFKLFIYEFNIHDLTQGCFQTNNKYEMNQ